MNLIIMAAGMGSRFGGLKQIEPVDKNENFIIDYSIFDAIRCGFDKVIFIIKPENLEIFKQTIGKRIEPHIKTEYAFQTTDISKFSSKNIFEGRQKPLGTGHAVLAAKDLITSDFAVINADDYYGYNAINQIAEFLRTNKNTNEYALVGYPLTNTLSNKEPLKRGICTLNGNNLVAITESLIEQERDKIFATPLGTTDKKEISKDTIVSVNLFALKKEFLPLLESAFINFIKTCDPKNDEFFLPTVISNLNKNKVAISKVLTTTSKWHGITYKLDKLAVENYLNEQKQLKIYPKNLWN